MRDDRTHTSRIDVNSNVTGIERNYDVCLSGGGKSGTIVVTKNRADKTAYP